MIKLTNTQKLLSAVIFALTSGIAIGASIGAAPLRKEVIGNLRIDTSEPDEPPYMFLELTTNDVPAIMSQRYVRLKVNTESFLSRK